MWLLVIQNIFRCTEFYEGFQNNSIASEGILDRSIEFSVRKGTGTAFTELHICLSGQFAGFPEMLHRLLSFSGIGAALDDHRCISM